MHQPVESILSIILAKQIRGRGYDSLRKFHEEHKESIGVSYELLRQVMHAGRIPRIETLLPILAAAKIPRSATRNLIARLYTGLHFAALPESEPGSAAPTPPADPESGNPSAPVSNPSALRSESGVPVPGADSPIEIARRLQAALSRIPEKGNEDLWEMALRIAEIAERKVRERDLYRLEQPFLFGKEPEAIYQFLVRRGKSTPFMSRGEEAEFRFRDGIDYRDRYRGALFGQAIGSALGRITLGLSGDDVAALYGEMERPARQAPMFADPGLLRMALLFAESGRVDPESLAEALCIRAGTGDETEGDLRFSTNRLERGFPWHEAGEPIAESAPAARIAPVALLGAGDFRKLKLDAGIVAAISHPNPSSIAGAILMALSIARALHTAAGALDPISFARSAAPMVSGIESERAAAKAPRGTASLARKIGTELPALLLRRASVEEIANTVGNGVHPAQGIPFSLACVLANPSDFRAAVLSAVCSGHDSVRTASMAGALSGALLGASSIPSDWTGRLEGREAIGEAADALLARAGMER